MYLTTDEIIKSIKGLVLATNSASTGITSENIQIMIDDETAMVNGILSHRYVLPIDKDDPASKNAFNIVKSIVRYRVLCRLEMFLNLKGDSQSSQAIVDSLKMSSMFKEASRKILKGELVLDGVEIVDNVVAGNFPDSRFPHGQDLW